MEQGSHHEQEHHSAQVDFRNVAGGALEAAESYLARSPGPGPPGDGGGEAFSASFSALLDWGVENKLIRVEADFPFLQRPPDGHGDEHEAWFDEESNRWFKLTYRNRFGLAWGRNGSATAREYLLRLILQNTYFGDDLRLVALLNCNEGLRVLTSQPHIAGGPAAYGEIREWFCSLRFCRLEIDGCIAWYHDAENLLIADAHEGNVIRTPSGELVPIDLNVIQPTGSLLEWAVKASEPVLPK